MREIFAKLPYEMEKRNDCVLTVITEKNGSAPRGTGSLMLVSNAGRAAGSIGGGAIEKRAEEIALALIAEKRSDTREFRLNLAGDTGMLCGGNVTVFFQYIPHDSKPWLDVARAAASRMETGLAASLVLRLSGNAGAVADENGAILAGEIAAENEKTFSLPLPIGERAVIFGAGHIASALVPILKSVGFRPVVYDDRPDFAAPSRFPDAERVVLGDFTRIADFLPLLPEDYIVVMTSAHSHDFEVQSQALRLEQRYIGVIGSAKKTLAVNARLVEAGVPENRLKRVHTPIGTAIGAVTPAEIAVSIAGEMILVRSLHREGKAP